MNLSVCFAPVARFFFVFPSGEVLCNLPALISKQVCPLILVNCLGCVEKDFRESLELTSFQFRKPPRLNTYRIFSWFISITLRSDFTPKYTNPIRERWNSKTFLA
jgi:hypothetical protein